MTSTEVAAGLAAIGFLTLAGFQGALAAGVPWGRAAWGGQTPRLPRNLRIASAVSMVVWIGAGIVVLDRAGMLTTQLPTVIVFWGTWVIVALLLVGAFLNFASSSRYERFGWGPFALAMAILTLLIALS